MVFFKSHWCNMPNKCCVPLCRGNYGYGNKVCVFSFPKDNELSAQWVRAIRREDFVPTNYTKVCELHFNAEDVERENSHYDERTGRTLTAPLAKPRLRRGAVPSKLPGKIEKPNCDNPEKDLKRHKLGNHDDVMQQKESQTSLVKDKYDKTNDTKPLALDVSSSQSPKLFSATFFDSHNLKEEDSEQNFSIVKTEEEYYLEIPDYVVKSEDSISMDCRKRQQEQSFECGEIVPPFKLEADNPHPPPTTLASMNRLSPHPPDAHVIEGESFQVLAANSTSLHPTPETETSRNSDDSQLACDEEEADNAFCAYIFKELQNVKNPRKKRLLKVKIVSEILNAQL